jgi:hypothetical protein
MSTRKRMFLILLYLLPIPGLPWILRQKLWPVVNDEFIEGADYLLVQAFGRDSLSDKTVSGALSALFENDFDDLLSCLGKLEQTGFEPGIANRMLAKVQQEYMDRSPKMVSISQWEVVYAHWQQDKIGFAQKLDRIEPLWPTEAYFATVHVKRSSKAVIVRRGLSPHNGIELAHPDMVIRAKLILWKLGLDPAISLAPIPYAPESVQWWVRNVWFWFPRETALRLQHVLFKWVSFKPPIR